MKAIEKIAKTNEFGILKVDIPLTNKETEVKIIILISDDEDNEEKLWIKSISTNPVFDFLKDDNEDIYTLSDGEPFNG